MELDHEFTVPVPVDRAWSVLLDVERVASCMPGATLDSVDGEEYAGRMKVKVGAMTITYRGTARIVAADAAARTVTIEAAAKEARGAGTAAATVRALLHDEGDRTRVTVRTTLNVTGRPAQFGRNILAEVGAKLISRFAKALAAELEAPGEEPTEPNIVQQAAVAEQRSAEPEFVQPLIVDQQGAEQAAEAQAVQPQTAEQAAEAETVQPQAVEAEVVEPQQVVDQQGAEQAAERAADASQVVDQQGAEQAAESAAASAETPVAPVAAVPQQRPASPVESTSDDTPPDPIRIVEPIQPAEPAPVTAEAVRPAEPLRPVTPIRPRDDSDDAIDLLEIAGPSLAKRAVPALGALVALLLVFRYLVRRRR
ncbi:SRPBCC family protein [Actinomadura hibisca]|uniref:SRPBCC family protein n=1 Tax=Actinomadura hibisca TaxID=68565 RepID=UPI000831A069|nr:SRPBCC family protein [Actinomadura hibisca]